VAQAWARVCAPRHDGAPAPEPGDPAYRFALVQSQRPRRLLERQAEQLDLLPFVRFHYHLARWFAGAQATPRLARALRALLGEGLAALGLAQPAELPAEPVAVPGVGEAARCPPSASW